MSRGTYKDFHLIRKVKQLLTETGMVGKSYFNHRKRKVSKLSAGGRLKKNNQALSYLRQLEMFYDEKTKGIIIRARARWHEHGEKSTKYFLNLEKRNHVKKHIRKLWVSGAIKTGTSCILKELERFYSDLYKSKNHDPDIAEKISSFLNNLDIPKLSEEQKISCQGKITPDECFRLLVTFQNNKTPGDDGIPIEFYKKFWPLVNDCFIRCVNECLEKGEMSSSQKQAVITLIEKQGKDRSFFENWRPISLVNVDTKIMSARLKNVLPYIIHHRLPQRAPI